MKIEEAIKRIDILLVKPHPGWPLEDFDAVKLGREALKRLQHEKNEIPVGLWNPLPGETED